MMYYDECIIEKQNVNYYYAILHLHFQEYVDYHEDSPLQVLRVKQGKRYRFRFINSGSQICPLQLQVYKI